MKFAIAFAVLALIYVATFLVTRAAVKSREPIAKDFSAFGFILSGAGTFIVMMWWMAYRFGLLT